jgi:hypothetical protein
VIGGSGCGLMLQAVRGFRKVAMIRVIVLAAAASGIIIAPALWLGYPRRSNGRTQTSIRAVILWMAWALAVINLFIGLPSLCLMIALYADLYLGAFIDIAAMLQLLAPILPAGLAAFAIWAVLAIVLLCRCAWGGVATGNRAGAGVQDWQSWPTLALAAVSLVIAGPEYLINAARMLVSLFGCSLGSQRVADPAIFGTDWWCAALSAVERWPVLSASAVIRSGWAAFALWTVVALLMYLIPRKTLTQTGN